MTDTGFQFAGAGASESFSGSTTAWSNPGRVVASDNSRAASAAGLTSSLISEYLVASGFDLSAVPAGATINGVEVQIERLNFTGGGGGGVTDNRVRLRKGTGGTESGDKSGGAWPTSETVATYGTASDLWGLALAQSDLATLQVLLSATGLGGTAKTASVDAISVRVTYTPATSGAPRSFGLIAG